MSSQLRKCAGAQVDNDPRRPTLEQVAAAGLSRIWTRGTSPEYCELHSLQFLSARALRLLAARIVPEPARDEIAARAPNYGWGTRVF